MAFYVYILQSEVDGTFYKGFTEHPLKRLQQHNNSESKYTALKIPWKLVGLLIFSTKKDALVKEKKLKKYSTESLVSVINSSEPLTKIIGISRIVYIYSAEISYLQLDLLFSTSFILICTNNWYF